MIKVLRLSAIRSERETKREGGRQSSKTSCVCRAHVCQLPCPCYANTKQVQYSVLDQRPGARMGAAAKERNISLLAYGTLLGGFFSEQWLGKPDPKGFDTVSQQKVRSREGSSRFASFHLSVLLLGCLSAQLRIFFSLSLSIYIQNTVSSND